MADRSFLSWPFFDEGHRALARDLERGRATRCRRCCAHEEGDLDSVYACVGGLVRALGRAGWLRACVPRAYGGLHENVDVRTLCAGARNAGPRLGPGRLRARDAGPGQRAGQPVRQRRRRSRRCCRAWPAAS